MKYFANFEFKCTLFSKGLPDFCRPEATSVFKIQRNAFGQFIFLINKIKVRNYTTKLTYYLHAPS